VPDNYVAWAVGGKKYPSCAQTGGGKFYGKCTNTNSLSIEMCDDKKDGTVQASDKTIANAQELTKELMAKYNIPIENVIRHFDVVGKLCPAYYVDEAKWATFKAGLEDKNMDNTPASYAKEAVNWAVKKGIMSGNEKGDLMLNKPITREQFVTMLYRFAKLIGKA
jgi:N-acetylmuramoyl-L-alanine amidase CwlA